MERHSAIVLLAIGGVGVCAVAFLLSRDSAPHDTRSEAVAQASEAEIAVVPSTLSSPVDGDSAAVPVRESASRLSKASRDAGQSAAVSLSPYDRERLDQLQRMHERFLAAQSGAEEVHPVHAAYMLAWVSLTVELDAEGSFIESSDGKHLFTSPLNPERTEYVSGKRRYSYVKAQYPLLSELKTLALRQPSWTDAPDGSRVPAAPSVLSQEHCEGVLSLYTRALAALTTPR